MLQSIRLRNLRSFPNDNDAPYVDLKPLTVLIGKNSSGKSSFLRSLPLLRQSVEANTTGPILWYSSYVDFGAFSEAQKDDSEDSVIYFDFKLNLNFKRNLKFRKHYRLMGIGKYNSENAFVTVNIGVTETKNKTVAKELTIEIYDKKYSFIFEENFKCKLYIDGSLQKFPGDLKHFSTKQFLPRISLVSEEAEYGFNQELLTDYFYEILYKKLEPYFCESINEYEIQKKLTLIGIMKKSEIKETLIDIFKDDNKLISNFEKNEDVIRDIVHHYSLSSNILNILEILNNEMEKTFSNVKYIAPLRSTAERYYRHQDLQVKEIDHTGSNLAMLLRSFDNNENKKFCDWTMKNFDFQVQVKEEGLHYALKIKIGNDGKEYNINDMGFGFSQILPIVASIWIEITKRRSIFERDVTLLFAIEQPELHLHPEYQVRLAKMFASVIRLSKSKKIPLTIVFETHSQTIIDTLGDCIESNKLDPQDVNIVLFDKDNDNSTTNIKFSHFNNEGFLESWPIGFFSGRK